MKRKRLNGNRVNPLPIITTTCEIFKSIVSQPSLKNLILVIVVIAQCPLFRINEISRHLSIDVKTEKTKQKRLLRFLSRKLEKKRVMVRWATFVLETVLAPTGEFKSWKSLCSLPNLCSAGASPSHVFCVRKSSGCILSIDT